MHCENIVDAFGISEDDAKMTELSSQLRQTLFIFLSHLNDASKCNNLEPENKIFEIKYDSDIDFYIERCSVIS